MKNNLIKNHTNRFRIIKILIVSVLLFVILTVGFLIRTDNPDTTITNNVVAYYYDRTNRLIQDGLLPAFDKWGFAPKVFAENIPPFLSYATFFAYKAVSLIVGEALDVKNFILLFPVLIYLIWAVSIFFVMRSFCRQALDSFLGILIITLAPMSIASTSFGHYTEDTLGLFLFFICFWLFLKRHENLVFYIGLVFSLTALVLTWQQFHIFFIAMGIVLVANLIFSPSPFNRKKLLYDGLLFVLPLILGHFISVNLLGINYSPIQMIKEFWIGLKDFRSNYILTAMKRNNWIPLSTGGALTGTGLFLGLLMILGMIRSACDWRNLKYRSIFLFNAVAIIFAMSFSKNGNILLPFGLYAATIGWESVIEAWQPASWNPLKSPRSFIKKYWLHLLNAIKKNKKTVLCVFAGILLINGIIFFALASRDKSRELPRLQIDWVQKPDSFNNQDLAKAKILIKNNGGDSLLQDGAAAGIHVELENAEASMIVGRQSGTTISPVLKPDYRRGNIFWFEIAFKPLKKNEEVSVEFNIRRTSSSRMTIFYRGWLPDFCPLDFQRETIKKLTGEYSDLSRGGWRDERCLIREPASADKNMPICPIEVFAGYKDPQFYRCNKLEF